MKIVTLILIIALAGCQSQPVRVFDQYGYRVIASCATLVWFGKGCP